MWQRVESKLDFIVAALRILIRRNRPGDEKPLDPVLEHKLDLIFSVLERMEKKLMASLDETLEKVRAANTKQDSLIALTRGIKAQLDAVLAGALTPAQQEKVDAIFKEVADQADEVDAAITENTPTV